jgi:tRNA(Ile)-lysidine synthase
MSERILPFEFQLLTPGLRVIAAVSGGADSVALLRMLVDQVQERGIVLKVAHVHHGIRAAAEEDAEFVARLAQRFDLEFLLHRVDVPGRAAELKETIEEAARNVRYSFFQECLVSGQADVVATAHTLDDQAETVLLKLLRGAWTEGLGGIHPVVELPIGRILRPLLSARRSEVEAYLHSLGQDWREDESNRELAFARNRVRHELLPLLGGYNPQIASQLAALSSIARDEERYWQGQLKTLLPQILLPGKPVRGGGRSAGNSTGLALEVERVRSFDPAVQRRILRAAVAQAGGQLDFHHTEALLGLTVKGTSGQQLSLPGNLVAERTPRELRIFAAEKGSPELPEYRLPLPGEVEAEAFGLLFRAEAANLPNLPNLPNHQGEALVRAWKPGDRVTLRYSRGPKKVKEVLERMRVPAPDRAGWPVVVYEGRVLWIRGAEAEPEPGVRITAEALKK